MRFIQVTSFLLVLFLSSCALLGGGPSTGEAASTQQIKFTEPNILRKYKAFYVSPVIMATNDSNSMYPASDREINDLAATFREQIIRALDSKSTNFNQPARDVAIINIVVYDVWSESNLLNLRPGIVVPNEHRGGATMSAKFYDSVSKKEIGYVFDSKRGARQGFLSGLGKWDGAKKAFSDWASLLARASEG